MAIAHLLEDFTSRRAGANERHLLTEAELEDVRLAAFEKGYGAGWDDALKSQGQKSVEISDGLVQAVNEMSFSYHEARAQLIRELEPVFLAMTQTILPASLQSTLGLRLVEKVTELAVGEGDLQVEVKVSDQDSDHVESALSSAGLQNVTVMTAPDVGPAEAYLNVGDREIHVDPSQLLADIDEGITAYFHDVKEISNG
jgi:flagellar assembly protein FliH